MENLFEVTFSVNYILLEKNNFYILSVSKKNITFADITSAKDYSQYTITGFFDEKVMVGDTFNAMCKWKYSSRYGYSLEVSSYILSIPSSENGIAHFLSHFCAGIGIGKARKIVSEFGTQTLDTIKEKPELLTSIKGISKKNADTIHNCVMKHSSIEELSVFLFSVGVTNYNDVVSIYSEYKENAIDIIKSNPYVLCSKNSQSMLALADTICLGLGMSLDSVTRLSKIILCFLSNDAFNGGDMYSTYDSIKAKLGNFCKDRNIFIDNLTPEKIDQAIDELASNKEIIIDKNFGDSKSIYLFGVYELENKIANMVSILANKPLKAAKDINTFNKNFKAINGYELAPKQLEAVSKGYKNKISIITGGPGTGKTLTVNALIDFIKFNTPEANIILAAPTGRAAKRMTELTGQDAYTLHRLLRIHDELDHTKGSYSDIECDYLICDEMSMADAQIFFSLLDCVIHCGASLILVGDVNQLPPVSLGMVFKDLCESNVVKKTVLDTLFRQAALSQININAKKILTGVEENDPDNIELNKDFYFLTSKNDKLIKDTIVNSVKKLLNNNRSLDDIMVLTPMRKSLLGVEELNNELQNLLNPLTENSKVYRNFRVGDRVMQIKNNYNLGVFNGDIGYIQDIDLSERLLTVKYNDLSSEHENGGLVSYEFDECKELELAYAITIHKSQGSEFPCVIMPVSNILRNLSKSIIYTCVTRAKSLFIALGDKECFYNSISITENSNKLSHLIERLHLLDAA